MYVVPEINGKVATAMLEHSFADGHIESPKRLQKAMEAISTIISTNTPLKGADGNIFSLHFLPERLISDEEVLLGHSKEMLQAFQELENGKVNLTHFPASVDVERLKASTLAARVAAGLVLQLVDAIKAPVNPLRRGIALVRPPGHHCTRSQSSGNGMLNNVALAALYAVKKYNMRVLIVDIDIHLSGGTTDLIQNEEKILLVDIYGARGQELRARARAEGRQWQVKEVIGNTIALNVALLRPTAGDEVYTGPLITSELLSAAKSHRADVVFISCGFDAAKGDDEGFELSPAGYGKVVDTICTSTSPSPPCILVLEGGYKPQIVFEGVTAVVNAMASSL